MRAEGKIPAVLYGEGQDPLALALDPALLVSALDPELKRNTLISLEIDDDRDASCLAMVKDAQVDPLRDVLIHVDLIRVQADQEVEVEVELILTGRSEGVKLGGILQQVFRKLPIRARVGAIPSKIVLDTTDWQINDMFRASDLPMPDNVTLLLDPKQNVASVVMGRAADEEEEAKAAEGEGEEGAPAGEEAKPADADKTESKK